MEAKLDSIALNASACSSATHMQQFQASLNQSTEIKCDLFKTQGNKLDSLPEEHGQDRYKASLDKRLDRIASAVGVKASEEDDDDRKRLKEKLKLAIERDKRSRIRKIESEQAKWLEYIFGICKADQRCGKRGSRFFYRVVLMLMENCSS